MRKTVFGCLGAAAVAFALLTTPAHVQAQGLFGRFCDPCDAAGNCDPCDRIGNGSCFDSLNCDPCEKIGNGRCFDSLACDPCEKIGNGRCFDGQNCDPCGACNGCGTKAGKWFLNGHMEAGFFANAHGNRAQYDGPGFTGGLNDIERPYDGLSGNTELLQNTRLTGAQINQVYISMGKSVDGRRGLDIGGTVDFTWGSDAYMVQARGLEYAAGHGTSDGGRWGTGDYFAAFAQAYIEAEYGRWNVKAGKFYAPFGIDSYKSTDNFFYSWSPTMIIAPTFGGGAYATYTVNNRLAVMGGWVMPDGIGESSHYNCVLGGFDFQAAKRLNLRYAFAAGKNKYDLNPNIGDIFVNSFTLTSQINKRLRYVFDWTYLNNKVAGTDTSSYALMNELIYQYNKRWAFGTRFGVLRVGKLLGGAVYAFSTGGDETTDWSTVSLGANWTPNKWLVVKPELRYDWTNNPQAAVFKYDGTSSSTKGYQFSGGVSAVVKF